MVRHPSLPEIVDNFSAAAPALHFHLRTDCSGQRKRMRPRAFVQLGPLPIPPGRFLSCEQGRLHPTGVGRRASHKMLGNRTPLHRFLQSHLAVVDCRLFLNAQVLARAYEALEERGLASIYCTSSR